MGALVRVLSEELPARASLRVTTGSCTLDLRSHAVLVDDLPILLPAGPMAILRRLAEASGLVVSREDLLDLLPGESVDTHALESAMARLRAALGIPDVIKTVVKRGYRLDLQPVRP